MSNGCRCAVVVIEHRFALFGVPVKAIGISVVVEGAALSVVSVAHSEHNRLTVFLIGAVLAGDRIATRAVFRPVKRYAIYGDGDFTTGGSTLVIAVSFRAVSGVMTAGCIIDWRTGNGPFVVLSACAIVALRTG